MQNENRQQYENYLKKKKYIKISAIILFIIGFLILIREPIKTWLVSSYHPTITAQDISKNQKDSKSANYNMNQVKPVSMNSIMHAKLNSGNIKVVGQIVIPNINVHLPIGLGVDNDTLMFAAGTMRANQTMGKGNYALAGHHMLNQQALFTPIYNQAKLGMFVYLTDMQHVYQYMVTVRQIISPYDVNVIKNSKQNLLTLITCNNSGDKRLLVQGQLTKTYTMHKAPNEVLNTLTKPTNNYNVLQGY